MFYVEMLKIIYTLFFQIDYYTHHLSRNKTQLISPTCSQTVTQTNHVSKNKQQTTKGESGYPCLVPDFSFILVVFMWFWYQNNTGFMESLTEFTVTQSGPIRLFFKKRLLITALISLLVMGWFNLLIFWEFNFSRWCRFWNCSVSSGLSCFSEYSFSQ